MTYTCQVQGSRPSTDPTPYYRIWLCISTAEKHLLLLLVGSLGRGTLLLFSSLLGLHSTNIVGLLLLSVPLASLENENADKNQSENSVAGGKNLQAVLATKNKLAALTLMGLAVEAIVGPDLGADASESLDNVGNVDTEADKVEDERCAVKEEVGLTRAEELDEEADKTDGDDDVENAADECGGLVHELQMRLEMVEEVVGHGGLGPEEREVIRERREKDTQEEAHRGNDHESGKRTRSMVVLRLGSLGVVDEAAHSDNAYLWRGFKSAKDVAQVRSNRERVECKDNDAQVLK